MRRSPAITRRSCSSERRCRKTCMRRPTSPSCTATTEQASRPPPCWRCFIGWALRRPTRVRGQRRQRLRRVAVPNGQIPARLSRRRLRRSGPRAPLGVGLRPLLQHRSQAQRHPVRRAGAVPCRSRSRAVAVARCAIKQPVNDIRDAEVAPNAQLAAHPCGDANPNSCNSFAVTAMKAAG